MDSIWNESIQSHSHLSLSLTWSSPPPIVIVDGVLVCCIGITAAAGLTTAVDTPPDTVSIDTLPITDGVEGAGEDDGACEVCTETDDSYSSEVGIRYVHHKSINTTVPWFSLVTPVGRRGAGPTGAGEKRSESRSWEMTSFPSLSSTVLTMVSFLGCWGGGSGCCTCCTGRGTAAAGGGGCCCTVGGGAYWEVGGAAAGGNCCCCCIHR